MTITGNQLLSSTNSGEIKKIKKNSYSPPQKSNPVKQQKERNLPPVNIYCGQPINVSKNLQQSNSRGNSKIVIYDAFGEYPGYNSDKDKDGIKDSIYHGDLVLSQIDSTDTHIIDATIDTGVNKALESTLDHINNGENIAAINISFGNDISFHKLGLISGINGLNSRNIKQKAPQVYEGLKETLQNSSTEDFKKMKTTPKALQSYIKTYELIEELANKGTTTVIAAGNKTDKSIVLKTENLFNINCLNPRALTVGIATAENDELFLGIGQDAEGKIYLKEKSIKKKTNPALPAERSFRNSSVDIYADGEITKKDLPENLLNRLSRVKQTRQNKPDISEEELRAQSNFNAIGSSYSAPFITTYVKKFHDLGLTVDQINQTMKKAYGQAVIKKLPIESILDRRINQLLKNKK